MLAMGPALNPTERLQASALQVAAFAGPEQNFTSPPDASTEPPPTAPAPAMPATPAAASNASGNANASVAGPRASAAQLAGVYVLQRAFTLQQLQSLDGQLLQTLDGEQWSLRVHASPPAEDGVSGVYPAGGAQGSGMWGAGCTLGGR